MAPAASVAVLLASWTAAATAAANSAVPEATDMTPVATAPVTTAPVAKANLAATAAAGPVVSEYQHGGQGWPAEDGNGRNSGQEWLNMKAEASGKGVDCNRGQGRLLLEDKDSRQQRTKRQTWMLVPRTMLALTVGKDTVAGVGTKTSVGTEASQGVEAGVSTKAGTALPRTMQSAGNRGQDRPVRYDKPTVNKG